MLYDAGPIFRAKHNEHGWAIRCIVDHTTYYVSREGVLQPRRYWLRDIWHRRDLYFPKMLVVPLLATLNELPHGKDKRVEIFDTETSLIAVTETVDNWLNNIPKRQLLE